MQRVPIAKSIGLIRLVRITGQGDHESEVIPISGSK
jgi:hypothetical protein